MLNLSRTIVYERRSHDREHSREVNDSFLRSKEDMSPPVTKTTRSKRNSGFFDVGYSQMQARTQEQVQGPSVQRRTSKRASSQDRHGQVYSDEIPGFRSRTPDTKVDSATTQTSPLRENIVGASPQKQLESVKNETPSNALQLTVGGNTETPKAGKEIGPRPRTRTLEERIRSRSPQTVRGDARKRIGSFQSVSQLPLQEDSSQSGSIGYPSVIATSSPNSASNSRQRLLQTPPRPLSPANQAAGEASSQANVPQTDAERIMGLMRDTCGRMHGILYFRLSKSSPWQSGYCAINVGTGSLIYQTKGELAQTKTLIPDLRGCKVRTQFDAENQAPFLEMSTKATGLGIHLRPLLPETFELWLAALLYWQPMRPSGSQHGPSVNRQRHWRTIVSKSVSGTSTPTSSSTAERASSRATTRSRLDGETYAPLRESPMVKQTRVLWWDPSAPQSTPVAPPRRISTYKQQRMSAGPPWRKAVASIRENGFFELILESAKDRDGTEKVGTVAAAVELSTLKRYAIQKLHASVLDDEFSLAVYTQYRAQTEVEGSADENDEDEVALAPVFLSFETRVLFEAWYAMFRVFTIPELYGPGAVTAVSSAITQEKILDTDILDEIFRVKRSLFLRIVEAQLHSGRSGQSLTNEQTQFREDLARGDYHAEIHIDDEIRGRTVIQHDTGNPFWRADYEFNHLPPFAATIHILVYSRQAGQRDWTLISDERYMPEELKDANHLNLVEDIHISPLDNLHGTVELNLNDMDRGVEKESWWTLVNEFGEPSGRILLKIRVDETVILMSKEYEELSNLLHAFSNGVATETLDKCSDVSSYIPETLLNIFQVSESAGRWITTMIEDEIDSLQRDNSASRYRFSSRIASNDSYDSGVEKELVLRNMNKSASAEASLLFRGNTPLTKALEMHMRRLGKEFLEEILGERLRDIDESEPECEVDPNRVRSPEALQRNWRNLILLTESIWRSISTSANICPPELRQIFRHIRSCTEDRYSGILRTVAYSSVSSFLFLRLLVPAILNPSLFGLLKGELENVTYNYLATADKPIEIPRPKSRRTLTLIAKSLQTLANMTTFGAKEPWMEPMNAFLNGHRQEFKDFIDEVCAISQERGNQSLQTPRDFAAPLRVAQRLPSQSLEGFPSLPYLIDQPREFAILVNAWMDSRVLGGSVPVVNEDLARLDVLCNRLRQRTRDLLGLVTAQGQRSPSANDWSRLLQQFDSRGKVGNKSDSIDVSPFASPKTSRDEMERTRNPSQSSRPQPIRTSTAKSSTYKSDDDHDNVPTSGGSLGGFAAVAAAAEDIAFLASPTAMRHSDSKPSKERDGETETETPPGSSGPWESTDADSSSRGRITSIASGTTVGYIHPLAWGDPGSAGSGRSKTSSLRSLDVDAANNPASGLDGHGSASSALPWSGNAFAMDVAMSSPVTSPRERDPESRRLVDVLTFRRRERKSDKTEKEKREEADSLKKSKKKDDKKEEKKKEREDKRKGKEKGREGSSTDMVDTHRIGYGMVP